MTGTNKKPMENAEAIIERFGGIRPMSQKIDVAFTTIQGWKKRGTIPASRRGAILNAAMDHNIDLSGVTDAQDAPKTLTDDADHQESVSSRSSANDDDASKDVYVIPPAPKRASVDDKPSFEKQNYVSDASEQVEVLQARLAQMEKKMITQNMLMTATATILLVGAAGFLLWPKTNENAAQISQMKQEMATLEAEQSKSGLQNLIPQNLKAQIDGQINDLKNQATQMKQQVNNVQEQVTTAVNRVESISTDVLGEQAGNIEQRLSRLEGHVSELIGSPELSALMSRFQVMQNDAGGQTQLQTAVKELNQLFQQNETPAPTVEGEEQAVAESEPLSIEGVLQQAKDRGAAIGQTFEGVPSQELKAAGLLLGFTQVRGALNRDSQPFDEDLVLLQNLLGDNPELQAQIDKLAPHAESGVLTPSGLSNEFRSLAGDMVVSSLKGEDVSVTDRASAKLNELLQVEKDGELITGTPTQATINQTQTELEQGDLAAAIAAAKSLQGPEAQIIAPWIAKAEATLAGQGLETALGSLLSGQGIDGLMPKKLISNEETGINILVPATSGLPQ